MLDTKPLTVVLAGGLADGINPCAFTTLVFLVSFLQHEGIPRRRVLVAGAGYVGAVYITYFTLLLGLYETFRFAEGVRWVGVGVSLLAIALSLGFAAAHVRDLVVYRRTRTLAGMTAALPRRWVARIHDAIRGGLRSRTLFLGAATAGVLVAVVESACTGQIGFPTVAYLVREGRGGRDVLTGIGWLLVYVTAFIVPLVAVFAAAILGLSSSRLAAWARAHFEATKLILAVVLLWFAVVLAILVWKEVAAGI
ncbi:MAG: hypothetical protein AAB434_12185 [Planctomycetota bacterium]